CPKIQRQTGLQVCRRSPLPTRSVGSCRPASPPHAVPRSGLRPDRGSHKSWLSSVAGGVALTLFASPPAVWRLNSTKVRRIKKPLARGRLRVLKPLVAVRRRKVAPAGVRANAPSPRFGPPRERGGQWCFAGERVRLPTRAARVV